MQKSFIGIITGCVPEEAVVCCRALLDFSYLARLDTITESLCNLLQENLDLFHENKHAFESICNDFNFPKMHTLQHYIHFISTHGTLGGFSTELPERLHIDFAKQAYRATNKRDFMGQMIKWIHRKDAAHKFNEYMKWIETKRFTHKIADGEVDWLEESSEKKDRFSRRTSSQLHALAVARDIHSFTNACQSSFATLLRLWCAPAIRKSGSPPRS